MKEKLIKKKPDWTILAFVFGLVVFGLIMIGDISLIEAEVSFGDKFHFLKRQFLWALIGTGFFFIFSRINYRFWQKFSKLIFIFSLIALSLVFVPQLGVTAYGARRWLDLGFINFQPVELIKISSIIYFADLLSREEKRPLWQQLFILAIPVFLILLEPNFGSVVLLVTLVGLLWFFGGLNLIKIIPLAIIGLAVGSFLIFNSPYRKQRILGLLNPFQDPQGATYHAYQLALTLGSGGWFGKGMGESRQKYQYLPEATTDSIIALVAEEFGFLGITIFLAFFAFLIIRSFQIANLAPDLFGQLLGAGISGLIAVQGIINLGAMAIFFPLTGIPFPFVSYGGSSLISLMAAAGILLNVSCYRKEK